MNSIFEKKNFSLREKVRLHSLGKNKDGNPIALEGATGFILGKSIEHVLDHYIVMLDTPTDTALAVSITEACISRLKPE